jgi:threonine dehydrogenase-like Zn-dependent dehydrogenase
MCENQQTLGETLDGGFAEFNVASEKQLHKIDRGTEPELAVFVEPLSCVVGAFEVLRAFPGDIALVQGAGPIGLLFTLCLKSWGATVIVAEPSAFRRRYAVTCGANSVIDPIAEDLRHQLEDFSESGVDVVVDTVGSLLAQSLAVVRRHGRVILFGVNDQAISNVLQYEITRNSLQVMGTFVGSGVFPRAIRLIVEGIIDVQRLISHRMPLREIGSGLQLLRSGEAVKLIIQP